MILLVPRIMNIERLYQVVCTTTSYNTTQNELAEVVIRINETLSNNRLPGVNVMEGSVVIGGMCDVCVCVCVLCKIFNSNKLKSISFLIDCIKLVAFANQRGQYLVDMVYISGKRLEETIQ